jgi:cytochrome c peroxidase
MKNQTRILLIAGSAAVVAVATLTLLPSNDQPSRVNAAPPAPPNGSARGSSSYMPVIDQGTFDEMFQRVSGEKAGVMKAQLALLNARYDLSDRPVPGVTMSRNKPVQGGVRVKLAGGVTWQELAAMPPATILQRGLWPQGFVPLPHPKQIEGGMVFPTFLINEIKEQEGRDLTRFDVDFDIPDLFLPEFPPPLFLTTRPDLGDVSQGKLITIENFYELFNGILNPKDLDGLRLLLTPFPQQQFNLFADRRSAKPSRGVACFDCHSNGHTNGSTHLVGDIRPESFRRRIDTVSLRGVNQQRLFGSQRALKTVEDFTEFEQRAAYFDGDTVIAQKKGVNILDRGAQVHPMAELQEFIDFPPAPKLDVFGHLDPAKASAQELRGEQLFLGKARCSGCHPPPLFSDNLMHDLKTERFYTPSMVLNRMTVAGGPTKTFVLRGIKDSPPYLHDERLLTLDDTVEFFNLVLGTQLTETEKHDLVTYLYTL